MKRSSTIHPGSIQAQVGACLEKIMLNIEQNDMRGIWNFTRQLQTLVSPYFDNDNVGDLVEDLRALPNPTTLQDEGLAYDNMQDRQAICLKILHRQNLYGYSSPIIQDATSLALDDEEEEGVLA